MKREIKIGIFLVAAILIFIWGFKFLKGQNILSRDLVLYAEYDNIDYLDISSPVVINGFQVGAVTDIYLKPEDISKVVVEFRVRNDLQIPTDALAMISPVSIMGGKSIQLVYIKACSGNCIEDGDYLKGTMQSLMQSMVSKENVTDYMGAVNGGVKDIIQTLNTSVKPDSGIGKTLKDLEYTMANLKVMSAQMEKLIVASSQSITGTMKNLQSITSNLEKNNQQISAILAQTNQFTGNLSKVDLGKTTKGADAVMADLQVTLQKANAAVSDFQKVLTAVNNGEGSIGALLQDKTLINNLEQSSINLDLLLQDLRLHPERYRRILSKKKMPYEKPQ